MRTDRVQRAKRLLSETDLPMTGIALQAGFGSLRRFDACSRKFSGTHPVQSGDGVFISGAAG